jgi:hypothetical protein
LIPPNVEVARLALQGPSGGGGPAVVFGHPEDGITLSSSTYLVRVEAADIPLLGDVYVDVPVDSEGKFSWMNAGAGGETTLTIVGYYDAR